MKITIKDVLKKSNLIGGEFINKGDIKNAKGWPWVNILQVPKMILELAKKSLKLIKGK